MIFACIYDSHEDEAKQLKKIIYELAPLISDEQWSVESFWELKDLETYLDKQSIVDIFIYDLSLKGAMEKLILIREKYSGAFLMILADVSMDPMEYIRPRVNARSLLLKPFNENKAYVTLKSFLEEYLRIVRGKMSYDDSILVGSRNEKINIPFDKIYYIEAWEKKLYICTGRDIYGFYGSMEGILKKLPSNFIRCHRSYIVNQDKINKIALSKSLIYLKDDIEVPLSRSYKADFKRANFG